TASPIVITTISGAANTALVNGTTYQVQIRAVNAAGDGTATGSTPATPATTPGAPTGLGATAGDHQVLLSWTAPVSDGGSAITDYTVQYRVHGTTPWQTFSDGVSTAVSATVTGLSNGTVYDFQVATVNAIG